MYTAFVAVCAAYTTVEICLFTLHYITIMKRALSCLCDIMATSLALERTFIQQYRYGEHDRHRAVIIAMALECARGITGAVGCLQAVAISQH